MKSLFLLLTLFSSVNAFSQKAAIIDKLKEYEFSEDLLTENLKDADAEYYFKLKTTTISTTETKVENGEFDPSRPIGERWKLLSVNGNTPSKKEIKNYHKAHNTTDDDVNGQLDDNAWKIENDDANSLVISFKYDKSTLPKKYSYLGDCKGMAYFNKNTKKLEKAEFVNVGDLKIKIFNVTHLDMVVYYYPDDELSKLIQKEELLMDVKLLGELVEIKEISEYSEYKKI